MRDSALAVVYLGLGSNMGDRLANLRRGLDLLEAQSGPRVLAASSLYETAPWGVEGQPPFYNAVVRVATPLPPGRLLARLKEIEGHLGRRPGPRWGPRPLDLDVLLYGRRVVAEEGLTVPHPRLAERAFVLVPLAELDADLVHPILGRTVGELLAALERKGIRKVAGPAWGTDPARTRAEGESPGSP